VRNELKDQVSDLVMQGVNAVLDKEVDVKAHQSMLKNSLVELGDATNARIVASFATDAPTSKTPFQSA
jgi:flagellar biosynthesis/type III secretory pathway protein FliH